ncbi:ABC transporter permease [Pseudochelatococcus sp. B33]
MSVELIPELEGVKAAPAIPDGRPWRWVSWLPSIIIVVVIVLWAIFPGLFTWHDPLASNYDALFYPPSLDYPFGTDQLGRDVYARVVHGTSNMALTAGSAVVIGFFGGTIIGAAGAGIRLRIVDHCLMRINDTLLAVPGLLVALVLTTVYGASSAALALGVGISLIPPFARVVRSSILRVRALPYVEAVAMSGASTLRIAARHVVPNSVGPVISLVGVEFNTAIIAVGSLGFLGYGAPPPTPEWGQIVADGTNYIDSAWWLSLLPSLVLLIAAISINRTIFLLKATLRY